MILALVTVITLLLGWLYIIMKNRHNYWKRKGLAQEEPYPIFGSSLKFSMMKQSWGQMYDQIYRNHKDKPYVGFYEGMNARLMIMDPEYVAKILIKDFSHFSAHFGGLPKSEVDDFIFFMRDIKWRAVRQKFTPAFTVGKLRSMFPEMINCSNKFLDYLEGKTDSEVNMKHISSAFTMTVIASTAFGLDVPVDTETEFYKMGHSLEEVKFTMFIKLAIFHISSRLASFLGLGFTPRKVAKYFAGIIKDTLAYRQKEKVSRNDFVQLLLQIKEKGSIEMKNRNSWHDDDKYLDYAENATPETTTVEISDSLLISQAYNFLSAGFDPMTIVILYSLVELSNNQEIQERARQEVYRVTEKHGTLTFDALKEATFLNNCISEVLRKFPVTPFQHRECTKDYELEPGLIIEKGTPVIISNYSLQNDPKYYPEPEKFNPDRFLEPLPPHTYFPFGDGPRICMGMRYSLLVVKLAVAVIISKYKIRLSPKTELPLKLDVRALFIKPKDDVFFLLDKIEKTEAE